MPQVLFDHAIKYAWDLDLQNSEKYYWLKYVQKWNARDYSYYCVSPGTIVGGEPCTPGECGHCLENQICETKAMGSFLCHTPPGKVDKTTGKLTFQVPTNSRKKLPVNFDSGDQCKSALSISTYELLREDYGKALYNEGVKVSEIVYKSKFTLDDYHSGDLKWVTSMNYDFYRNQYSNTCTGSQKGKGCSSSWFSSTFCNAESLCEDCFMGNTCRYIPNFARDPASKSSFAEHYPDNEPSIEDNAGA
jgi:hypothetical protein